MSGYFGGGGGGGGGAATDFVAATAGFFGTSASGTIASNAISVSVGPYLTTAMASNRGSDFLNVGPIIGNYTSISATFGSGNVSLSVGPYLTTAMNSTSRPAFSADASSTFQTLTLQDSNGISFSNNAGAIRLTHALQFTSNTSAITSNAMNSTSRPAFSADASSTFQTLTLQNSNGVSFSNNAGAVRITHDLQFTSNTSAITSNAKHTTLSNLSLFAVSNTTQSTSGTAASNAFSFAGAGVASVGVTGGTVVVSVPAGGGGGMSVGASTDGNTAGSTGTVSNQMVLVGSNGITLSQSTGGASSATLTIAGWPIQSYFRFPQFLGGGSATNTQALQSTSHVEPFEIHQPVSFDILRLVMSNGITASTTAATTGNTQFSGGCSKTHNIVLYTRGTGANSMSLRQYTSTQITDDRYSFNVSAQTNSTQFSYSMRYTFPASGGPIGITKDYSSSAASLNFHSSHVTDLTAGKILDLPFAASLSPGQYWIAYGVSSATASQFTADVTRGIVNYSNVGATNFGFNFGLISAASNQSVQAFPGVGFFQTAGGGTTASIPQANISVSNNQWMMLCQFIRIA